VPRLAQGFELFLQKDFTYDHGEAADRRGPAEILDSHADFLIQIKQERQCPILGHNNRLVSAIGAAMSVPQRISER